MTTRETADWRYITIVFTGSGSGTFKFPPERVGVSQRFNLTWRIVWRYLPNRGYPNVISESISGRASFIGRDPRDDCSGKVAPAKGVEPQITPRGTKGRYTLLGAGVPLFGDVAVVPSCAQRPGYPIYSGIVGVKPGKDADLVKHQIAVAEFPLDYSNPGGITLTYPRKAGGAWARSDGTGASQTLQWRGRLAVTVVK